VEWSVGGQVPDGERGSGLACLHGAGGELAGVEGSTGQLPIVTLPCRARQLLHLRACCTSGHAAPQGYTHSMQHRRACRTVRHAAQQRGTAHLHKEGVRQPRVVQDFAWEGEPREVGGQAQEAQVKTVSLIRVGG